MSYDIIDLTVIIFSYNRHKYLLRTLKFYSRFKIKVLVIDGSENILENKILKKNNIEYYYLKENYYARFAYASNKIKTKYVIIGNDDEFLMINTLKFCIKFLENNLDYASCVGSTIIINPKYKKTFYQLGYIFHKDNQYKEERPIDRLRQLILNPSHHGYNSVIRKETFVKIGKFLENYQVEENIFFNELIINLLIVQDGKTNWINQLTWIRSYENDPVITKDWQRDLTKQQNYFHWFNDLNENEKNNIIFKLSNNLFKNYKKNEYFEIINKAVKGVTKEKINKHNIKTKRSIFSKFLGYLSKSKFRKNKLTIKFLEVITSLNFIGKLYGMRLKDIILLMNSSNTKYDKKELKHIDEIVLKFHS